MVQEILKGNHPVIQGRAGCNEDGSKPADKTAGVHKAEQKSFQLFILREVEDDYKQNLDRA